MVVGHDHIDARGTGGSHGSDRGNPAIARDDQPRAHALRFPEARGTKVIAIADPMRHKRMHGAAGAAQNARQHRGGTLAVHVVVAVHQDRLLLADRARHELHREGHIGPTIGLGEPLEIRTEEGFGRIG